MGWKGTLRSIRAEIKREEKRQIQLEKQWQADQARNLVYDQDKYLIRVKSFHKAFIKKQDWNFHLNASEPMPPEESKVNQLIAIATYEHYKPNFFIRLLRLVNWRKKVLKNKIEKAKVKDKEDSDHQQARFVEDHRLWKKNKDLAERIFLKDIKAFEEVLSGNNVFRDGTFVFKKITFEIKNNLLHTEVDILEIDEIMPTSLYSVTKTGKISEKDFPKTQYHQLYQDYVSSITLAVLKALFAFLPEEKIIISSFSNILNKVNGNLERQPLLSMMAPRATLQAINLDYVDPSECLKNFNHNMSFKNTTGFSPTQMLIVNDEEAS